MEKRFPYKSPWPWLCGVIVVLSLMVAGCVLLLPGANGDRATVQTAAIFGMVVASFATALVITMRALRPSHLVLRDDGIFFPGPSREGWHVAFDDIEEVRFQPPFLGCRILSIKAQGRPWSNAEEERWWSISERALPTKAAFDEVCNYILAQVDHASEQRVTKPSTEPSRR